MDKNSSNIASNNLRISDLSWLEKRIERDRQRLDEWRAKKAQSNAKFITHGALDLHLNRSMKLMRLFNESLDTLNRHRRKGSQKITVQHVHVNDGGQAVVGNFSAEGE